MPSYIVEHTKVKISNTYQTNANAAQLLFATLKALPYIIHGYHGTQVQDPETFCLLQGWESIEKHRTVIADKAAFQVVTGGTTSLTVGPKIIHVEYTKDPYPVFNAPLTEIATVRAKKGVSREDVILPALKNITEWVGMQPGLYGTAYGPVIEEENVAVAVLGWENIELWEKTTNADDFLAGLAKVREIADIDIKHIALTNFI